MSAESGKRLLEEQDELDYNIIFPATTGTQDPETQEPVIYLLGWAGATDKCLARYSSIYEAEGCVTIRYIHPEDDMFFFSSASADKYRKTAEKLCQLLEDYALDENPVFIHCFSNNGALLYRYMADVFQQEDVNLLGVIFDSCPTRQELLVGLRAIYFYQKANGMIPFLIYTAQFLFHVISNVFSSILRREKRSNFYQDLATSKQHLWPHLFLFSSNDEVIPPHHIMDMISARNQAGVTFVKKCNFLTSPHVHHLDNFEAQYTNECIIFLDDCLKVFDGDDPQDVVGQSESKTSSVDPVPVLRPTSEYTPSTSSGRKSSLRLRDRSQSETRI